MKNEDPQIRAAANSMGLASLRITDGLNGINSKLKSEKKDGMINETDTGKERFK
jgi:hypothetical protein